MMTTIDKLGAFPVERLDRTDKLQRENSVQKPDQLKQAGFSELLTGKFAQPGKQAAESASSNELKFSAHAKSRLNSRGIELSAEDIVKMQEAISKAGKKGSKESLVVTDKAAFVVSVKNNTVITAVDKDSLKENIFTNIDSTILI